MHLLFMGLCSYGRLAFKKQQFNSMINSNICLSLTITSNNINGLFLVIFHL